MARQPPHPQGAVPLTLEVYQKLVSAACATCFEKEAWEIAEEAIDEWMRRHHPDALETPGTKGYQWKRLFLPEGTLLRTVYRGKNYHCMVEGDRITYKERAVSPSGFVNAVGGTRRNSWRCTWILFPDTKDWKLADTLRCASVPRPVRKTRRPVQQNPGQITSTSCAAPTAGQGSVPPGPLPLPEHCADPADHAGAVPEAGHGQPGVRDPVAPPRIEDRRQRHTGSEIRLPRSLSENEAVSRINPQEWMMTLLRQELLPVLLRMCER